MTDPFKREIEITDEALEAMCLSRYSSRQGNEWKESPEDFKKIARQVARLDLGAALPYLRVKS